VARFEIKPDQVPKEMRNREAATRVAIQIGCFRAAVRAQSQLKVRSRKLANDRGVFANAWTIQPPAVRTVSKPQRYYTHDIVRVENLAPYAGIIELGARPHGVSAEGRANIREWVRRNIRVTTWSKPGRSGGSVATGTRMRRKKDPELDKITQAIVWKIQRYGQAPKYVVGGIFDKLHMQATRAIAREIKNISKQRKPTGAK
jgi:hypothetical protein